MQSYNGTLKLLKLINVLTQRYSSYFKNKNSLLAGQVIKWYGDCG
jgi:hypothetical protein